jgi:hypothetical protein
MVALGKHNPLRLPVMYGLLLSSVLACTRWQLEEISPERVVSEKKPSRILVTRLDSTRVELIRPHVSRDSLIGSATPSGPPVSIPLSAVANVSVIKVEPIPTIALVLGISGAAFAAIMALALAKNGGPGS